jgi:hypothetical protein
MATKYRRTRSLERPPRDGSFRVRRIAGESNTDEPSGGTRSRCSGVEDYCAMAIKNASVLKRRSAASAATAIRRDGGLAGAWIALPIICRMACNQDQHRLVGTDRSTSRVQGGLDLASSSVPRAGRLGIETLRRHRCASHITMEDGLSISLAFMGPGHQWRKATRLPWRQGRGRVGGRDSQAQRSRPRRCEWITHMTTEAGNADRDVSRV